MATQKINTASIQDSRAPSLKDHFEVQTELGMVESAWVEKGEPTIILIKEGGLVAEPGEPLIGTIYTDGLLITSDKPVSGLRGRNRLETSFLAAIVQGDTARIEEEKKEGKYDDTEEPPTLYEDQEIPKGELLARVSEVFHTARKITYGYKTGSLTTSQIIKATLKRKKYQEQTVKMLKRWSKSQKA